MIGHLWLEIATMRREQYGHSSEGRARLIDQMRLHLKAAATKDEIAAGKVTKTTSITGFERGYPARKPFLEHLQRERIVIEEPTACTCCASERFGKMGEDGEPLCAIGSRTVACETLRVIPRRWKVIQTVREKF